MPFNGLLSIVMPVYRSEAFLDRVVKDVVQFFEQHGRFELILVNDGSPDNVQRVIEELAAADPRIRYLELGHNRGQHAATIRGFRIARGEVVITLDDDGQNPPASGLAVVEKLQKDDLDVAYGRFRQIEQGKHRVIVSKLNRWATRLTIGNDRGIFVSNVRALRGDLARALGRSQTVYPFVDSMIFRVARRIADVEVDELPRQYGQSTYTLTMLVVLFLNHITTLSILPLRLITWGSFFVSVFGFFWGSIEMVKVLIERLAPPGWLSLFTATTFLFSILFTFLGIISLYLGRMYVATTERDLDWVRSASDDAKVLQTPANTNESSSRAASGGR